MADSSTRLATRSVPVAMLDHVVVRLRLIGQMEARTIRDVSVLPAGRKTRALFASIAMAAPRPMLRVRLAEQLWSRRPEEQARASLRQEIHRLLEALAPAGTDILLVARDHLTLRPGAVWIDAVEVMRATAAEPASLALLDGDLLEDLDGVDPNFDIWLAGERERLRDRARDIAESVLRADLEPDAAIPAAQRLLSIDRSHEGAWRSLMKAYAARGERGLAVQAFDRCRTVLADLLDAAPSPETQQLLTEIRGSPQIQGLPQSQPPAGPLRAVGAAPAPTATDIAASRSLTTLPPLDQRQAELPRSPPVHGQPVWLDAGIRTPPGSDYPIARRGALIGVMPLRLIGATGDYEHPAPGLADEISNALSRFRWMFVVSASSLERFAAGTRDEAELRREFGLDFLLDGSVQCAGDRIRISLRVVDLRAGNQIVWARRFDRETGDLLTLQDEITAEVVAQVDNEIMLIEARRSNGRGQADATAYDHVLRSIPLIWRMERQPFMLAGDYLAQAIAAEPDYAAAHAWYAYWHIFLVGQDWTPRPEAMMVQAGVLAERSIVLDPFDARGLTISGHVKGFLHGRLREAMVLHERALSLNPNLAMAWALSAVTFAYAGDPDEAERRNNRYKMLSPLDPHAFFFDGFFVLIHLMKRDYEAAVEIGRTVSQLNPAFTATYKPYLAALGHLRRDQEAATILGRLLAQEPGFTIERFLATNPIERESDRTHYAEGLRLAGVPDRATPMPRPG